MGAGIRVGVLGGTFDPVHWGHLLIAEEARVRVGLERVLFVPTGMPWLKTDRVISPARHRLAMLRLAIASHPAFALSTVEVDREGPSYTVDTLEGLKLEGGPQTELFFILGADSFRDLPRWESPRRIVELCYLVCVPRPGLEEVSPAHLEGSIPGITARAFMLEGPLVDISASDIRRRVAAGISIRYRVPQEVEDYILEHQLYKGGGQ